MKNRTLRQLIKPLQRTPLHPQWLVFRRRDRNMAQIGTRVGQKILDIGAGRQTIQRHLPDDSQYISLDYYQTSTGWYHVQPSMYGDGQRLPIASNSFDTLLLLDVLEHLPLPELCLSEAYRVLKPEGKLIIQVPFLYPLHDVPLDFQRWTLYGLRAAANRHGFLITEELIFGSPLETAAILSNLALSQTVLNGLQNKHPLALMALLLPGFVLFTNLAAWALSWFELSEPFMPQGYRLTWMKPG